MKVRKNINFAIPGWSGSLRHTWWGITQKGVSLSQCSGGHIRANPCARILKKHGKSIILPPWNMYKCLLSSPAWVVHIKYTYSHEHM